eukprot:12561533-Alexandrium_andersonii.AAC.1
MVIAWFLATTGAAVTQAPFPLPGVSRERLGRVLRRAAHTAAGADGRTPGEWAYLSEIAGEWLAKLVEVIEGGAAWPADTRL